MPTALVIDDSPIMRRMLKPLLEQADCQVVGEGASGDDLMHLYERHRPDVVTLDIVMPGKDGVTAATELLQRYPEANVVMCTSLTTRDKILACQKAGVRHYLLKPFVAEKVIAIIKGIVRGSTGERAAATPRREVCE